ncbi:unnamed protein product [Rhizoctonia solani]|uniref:Uncharacterized protein n=1 Tax=Rhizoctonia solani TaxID=456999 RepID=A0A8H3E3Q0_9AGAM|nr:unnamed protein product [Rhizoctonia solani]
MSVKVVGGYLLTYTEASVAAHKLGLSWNPDPKVEFGCRQEVNRWILANAPKYWSNRLQPIVVKEAGEGDSRLIFPIVGNAQPAAPDFKYSEAEGTPAKFREQARAIGLPDEFFVNFVTIHNPDISFLPVKGCPTRIRLRAH